MLPLKNKPLKARGTEACIAEEDSGDGGGHRRKEVSTKTTMSLRASTAICGEVGTREVRRSLQDESGRSFHRRRSSQPNFSSEWRPRRTPPAVLLHPLPLPSLLPVWLRLAGTSLHGLWHPAVSPSPCPSRREASFLRDMAHPSKLGTHAPLKTECAHTRAYVRTGIRVRAWANVQIHLLRLTRISP